MSGPEAFVLLGAHVRGVAGGGGGGATREVDELLFRRGARAARLALEGLDLPCTLVCFPGPRSYTGEDAAEIQVPGNPVLLERIVDGLIESGTARSLDVRRAEPGEYTARAYLSGRLDLTQAEGVAATIAARSDAELRAARLLTAGRLGTLARTLSDDLAAALALVEAGIDFTDQEDVVPIGPAALGARLEALAARIRSELAHAVGTEQLEAIPWVVLSGAPNAGKSTLFNALLGRRRVVVSPLPGTTRDVIAEPLAVETDHGPAEVMLVDLAGRAAAGSDLERRMQAARRETLRRAELILRCVPMDAAPPRERAAPREVLVRTKADLAAPGADRRAGMSAAGPPRTQAGEGEDAAADDPSEAITVSAVTGLGLAALRRVVAERLADRAVSLAADAIALRPRHEAALRATLARLEEASALASRAPAAHALADPELIAAVMRHALDALAALAGQVSPDDVLGRVFATFCVGK